MTSDSMPEPLSPFHLAIVVNDLAAARSFYGEVLGCPEGRSDTKWVDFDFFGHQLVIHERPGADNKKAGNDGPVYNPVDSHAVPVPHFGIVLDFETWEQTAKRLREKNVTFEIEPYVRFAGQPGEQGTMFFFDPSMNAIEIKGFRDHASLFAK